jgi:hypothetical protein
MPSKVWLTTTDDHPPDWTAVATNATLPYGLANYADVHSVTLF